MNQFKYKLEHSLWYVLSLGKRQIYLAIFMLSFFKISMMTSIASVQKAQLLQQLSLTLNSLASHKTYIPAMIKPAKVKFDGYTFEEWYTTCQNLPYYRDNQRVQANPVIKWPELDKTIRKFVEVNTNILKESNVWIDDAPEASDLFFKTEIPLMPIKPFLQKFIINPTSKIAFHGDFHGDIHSMVQYIKALQELGYMDGFTIKEPSKFYLVFLGDYVDRGIYGTEVLYTLMRLKIENPNNVILLRGNHEDREQNRTGGFKHEFDTKYSKDHWNNLIRIYDLLPVASYLGCGTTSINYLLCVHGGLETKFGSNKLLTSPQKVVYQWLKLKLNDEIKFPDTYGVGFMWSDFNVNPTQKTKLSGRGEDIYSFSKPDTELFLKNSSNPDASYYLKGIFRAHQHGDRDMMESIINGNGVSKLWQNIPVNDPKLWDDIVATFLVAPDNPYSEYYGYNYDAFGLLTTAELFRDWKLEIYNNEGVFSKNLKIVKKSQVINKIPKSKKELSDTINKLLERTKLLQEQYELYARLKSKLEENLKKNIPQDQKKQFTTKLNETIEKINSMAKKIKLLLLKTRKKLDKINSLT